LKGLRKMDRIEIKQTIFDVEPLKNVVGVGNTAAYRINVEEGRPLGSLGQQIELQSLPAANRIDFEHCEPSMEQRTQNTWLRRLLRR
jgi:hypothetical protein